MTQKQQQQFNAMHLALTTIAKQYQTPNQLRREAKSEWGLDYGEAIEMAYENIQTLAKSAIKGVKPIQSKP